MRDVGRATENWGRLNEECGPRDRKLGADRMRNVGRLMETFCCVLPSLSAVCLAEPYRYQSVRLKIFSSLIKKMRLKKIFHGIQTSKILSTPEC